MTTPSQAAIEAAKRTHEWVEVGQFKEVTSTYISGSSGKPETRTNFDPNSWGIRRRNKTSGKSRCGAALTGMSEYFAKTLCNDANDGSTCFKYQVVGPDGKVWELREVVNFNDPTKL